jgi:hypothetical protein
MLRSDFLSRTSEWTKKHVRTGLPEGLCPLLCPDGLVSEFQFSRVFWRTNLMSWRALQKLHICDSSYACPNRGLLNLLEQAHFLAHSSFLTPFSLISLGFWPKTLDPSRLKPQISNLTSETWSLRQDLRFHQFVWDKSKNSSFSWFRVNLESLSLIFQFSLGLFCFRAF